MPPANANAQRWSWPGPMVSLLLLAALAVIAWSLPASQLSGGYSTSGAFVERRVMPLIRRPELTVQANARTFSADLYFIRDAPDAAAPLRVIDPDSESWDEASGLLRDRPADVLRIRYRPEIIRSGFWGITHQVDHHALRYDFGSGFTPAQRDEARRMFIARAAPQMGWVPDSVFTTLLRGQTIDRSRVLYGGYALDLLTLLLGAAFIASLRWTLRVPAQVRALRGRMALSRGRCPGCGYVLAGLERGVCPECGMALAAQGQGPRAGA